RRPTREPVRRGDSPLAARGRAATGPPHGRSHGRPEAGPRRRSFACRHPPSRLRKDRRARPRERVLLGPLALRVPNLEITGGPGRVFPNTATPTVSQAT